MSIFSIAICDDERVACSQLLDMIKAHKSSQNFLVKTFYSGEALWEYVQENKFTFDLILLDIRLNEMNGIDVGKLLRESEFGKDTEILYISGDESYAMDLFKFRPINFLIKPINQEKLLRDIDDAIQRRKRGAKTYTFSFEKVVHNIPLDDILYFEATTKIINIHLRNGDTKYFYGKIDDVKKKLKAPEFIQIHYSFLVNWNHIKTLNADSLMMDNNTSLNISRMYKKEVQAYAKGRLGKE